MIVLDLSILNQKGTPMFNSDTFANRPAFGIVGRIFISTDTKEFFRDTGTSWELIGGPGSGTITGSGTTGTLPIWTSSSALGDSTLIEGATLISTTKDIKADAFYLTGAAASSGALYWTSDRVTLANYNVGGIVRIEVNGGVDSTTFGTDLSLTNNGYISAVPTLTAANNASSVAIVGVNTLSYAAAFSANNIGAVYGGIAVYNLQTFAGSATFANSNVASGGASINSIDFSSGGSTITMTQSSGIRVMSGQQNLFQYQGTNSGTITHAAISQNTGFYRPSAATGILTITNAYSHLINALDDYGAGFTFTNRWGIYQAGASDLNYFAANMLLGSTSNNGNKLQVTGSGNFTNILSVNTANINGVSLTVNGNTGGGIKQRFINQASSGLYNFEIGTHISASNAFEIGVSSLVDGTTFGNIFKISNTGAATFSGALNVGGNQTFTGVAGTTRYIITDEASTGTGRLIIQAGAGSSAFGGAINLYAASNPTYTGDVAIGLSATTGAKFRVNSSALDGGNDLMTIIRSTGNLLVGTTTDAGQKLYLNGSLRIDGQSSATSGGNSGQHLIINLDGTTYKIKLELP